MHACMRIQDGQAHTGRACIYRTGILSPTLTLALTLTLTLTLTRTRTRTRTRTLTLKQARIVSFAHTALMNQRSSFKETVLRLIAAGLGNGVHAHAFSASSPNPTPTPTLARRYGALALCVQVR